ncbi:MAG: hypothetical protein JWN44_202 [Myxococcales bacterium]|nr:hypothetical protein [Myxococcales bacterium]
MRRIAFLLGLIAFPSLCHAKETFEYLDLLTVEAVGELSTQIYDVRVDKRFVGNRGEAGVLVGGGFGIRPVFRFGNGVRLSLEASGTWGRLRDADPATSYSAVTRAEFLTGIGYEWSLGRAVVIHTATLVGLDYVTFEVAPRFQFFDASAEAAAATPGATQLERIDLRLGQQLGAHVQLASAVALFGDGTLDYDGQWRIRAGIAIGQPIKRGMR